MGKVMEVQQLGYQVGQKKILSDINLTIEKGEHVVISGPSGSGKSTLLKLMGSLISPTSGEILYDGQLISKMEPTDYRKKVSYCFQTAQLFGQTVKENLLFPYQIRDQEFQVERATTLLEEVGLTADFMEKRIIDLSGGEKQRVALIRNLEFEPEVLLLDEVTSALDDENAQIIRQFLNQLKDHSQMTLIQVTHVADEIKQAKRLIRIVDGKVVA